MTGKKKPQPSDRQAVLAFTQAYIESKSRTVRLSDILDLMKSYGIEGELYDVDVWARLAIALAIDAKKIKQPYAIPPKLGRRRSLNTASREAHEK